MDDTVPVGSAAYLCCLLLLLLGRGMDFLSTWLATPNLVLEANPLAKRLGWKWGGAMNLAICLVFACWPLPAIVIITTSVLVAARNFQAAWLMRTLGESAYRQWMAERLHEARRGVVVFCLLAQTVLYSAVGASLILFSQSQLVPLGVGAGIVTYAVAVAVFSALSMWRLWRRRD